jgi:hypothetical protein
MTGAPSQVEAPKRLLMTIDVVKIDEGDTQRSSEAKDEEDFHDDVS